MIKPTHYDNDGYPIQWMRSAIPANTLAALYGLASDCAERQVLGSDVEIRLTAIDEINTKVRPKKLIDMIKRDGGKALVGFIGVQSNQFPRAVDLARPFLEEGIPVSVGGFHVSGCLAMLKELPEDLKEAQEMGISFYAGELEENRLDEVFRDAWQGNLKPVYNYMHDLPTLQDQPVPFLPADHLSHTAGSQSSVDLGRGCPFQCSFCTIINVQGRKSRYRSPDDLERMIRTHYAQGVNRFFVTDDNFARNREWEALFDRLIHLREVEKLDVKFLIQVDTLCHKIPNFIEKAARAGVHRVFIGLENVNPDNLMAAKKAQNKITEYRKMLQQWKAHGVVTYAGYIIGFPNDTPESLLKDVEIIKNELALDLVEFNILTPLPGSEDHRNHLNNGVWMDPDMNKYDLNHWVMKHPSMSHDQFMQAYEAMWDAFFTVDHMETCMRRAAAVPGGRPGNVLFLQLWFYLSYKVEHVHPIDGGYFRRKQRLGRRTGMPVESALTFYPKFWFEVLRKHLFLAGIFARALPRFIKVITDPKRKDYMDTALTPPSDAEEELDIFKATRGSEQMFAKMKQQDELKSEARKAKPLAAAE